MSTENCPVGRTLGLLGEKWTLLVVREALNGVRRFDDFRLHIGLSDALLSDRLRKLVAAGVLETRPYRALGQRTRREYRLTEKGWDLLPVVVALKQWGDTHLAEGEGKMLEVRHDGCGGEVRVDLRCERHRASVATRETYAVSGPAARPLPRRP